MAVWVCRNCTARYAVGLFRCPQCRSENSFEEGSMSPKITRHGGPSDASDAPADVQEGGEPWAGTSSSTSSAKAETGDAKKSPDDLSPAPTTENPSSPDQMDSSTARSTDGESTTTTPPADQPDPYDGWLKADLEEELGKRGLAKTGNKAEMVARLREAAKVAADEPGE